MNLIYDVVLTLSVGILTAAGIYLLVFHSANRKLKRLEFKARTNGGHSFSTLGAMIGDSPTDSGVFKAAEGTNDGAKRST